MKINNDEYYESDKATVSDSQGDTTRDLNTITHTRNGKEKVTDTKDGNFEQKLLSNRTLPVVVLTVKPWIEPRTVPIVVVAQTLLTLNFLKVLNTTELFSVKCFTKYLTFFCIITCVFAVKLIVSTQKHTISLTFNKYFSKNINMWRMKTQMFSFWNIIF